MDTNTQHDAQYVYKCLDDRHQKAIQDLKEARKRLGQLEEIKRAASAQGDRSENAEYHAAIADINDCSTLILQLQSMIAAYDEFIRYKNTGGTTTVGIGTALHITDKGGRAIPSGYWVLVPEALSDIEQYALSVESPFGKLILEQSKQISKALSEKGEYTLEFKHNSIDCCYSIRR